MISSLFLGLALAAGIASPSFAAEVQPPPPPIDWSDFIDSLGQTPKDFVVGEEMC
jgi:hypothetical protein